MEDNKNDAGEAMILIASIIPLKLLLEEIKEEIDIYNLTDNSGEQRNKIGSIAMLISTKVMLLSKEEESGKNSFDITMETLKDVKNSKAWNDANPLKNKN